MILLVFHHISDLLSPPGEGLFKLLLVRSHWSNERKRPGQQHHKSSKKESDRKQSQGHEGNLQNNNDKKSIILTTSDWKGQWFLETDTSSELKNI